MVSNNFIVVCLLTSMKQEFLLLQRLISGTFEIFNVVKILSCSKVGRKTALKLIFLGITVNYVLIINDETVHGSLGGHVSNVFGRQH